MGGAAPANSAAASVSAGAVRPVRRDAALLAAIAFGSARRRAGNCARLLQLVDAAPQLPSGREDAPAMAQRLSPRRGTAGAPGPFLRGANELAGSGRRLSSRIRPGARQ